ncbi:MAG: hypothetical protein HZA58_07930 [Acidimicrobiia bacterium]|nr:hypothetical protein [Acidimicrobiia bacterium]
MTQLRRPLLALVALFTAAITIDRIGVESGTEAVSSTVYALAALAVAAPLALASLRRTRPWMAATVAVSSYATLLVTSSHFRNRSIYVIVTELVFLVLAVRLGHHLARTLARFDDTLGVIVFGDARTRDIESPEAAQTIHDEIARSRRHGRPLSLTVLTPLPTSVETAVDNAAIDVDRAVRRRYVYGKLARAVSEQLRRSDLLFEHRASGRLFVLSPETDPDGNTLLVKRVTEAAAIAGIPADAGSASFPDDAIAFESLVAAAEADLAAQVDRTPHLRAVVREFSR